MTSKYIILGLLTIVILCSILKINTKENYTILAEEKGPADLGGDHGGYEKVGNAMMAKDCQDACEKDPHCKYVNRPARLKNYEKGECWKAKDYEQEVTGAKGKGNNNTPVVTWYNEKYVKPAPSVYKGTFGGYKFRSRGAAENECKRLGLQLCLSTQIQNI